MGDKVVLPPTYREPLFCCRVRVFVRMDIQGDRTVGFLNLHLVSPSLQAQHGVAFILTAEDVMRVFETAHQGSGYYGYKESRKQLSLSPEHGVVTIGSTIAPFVTPRQVTRFLLAKQYDGPCRRAGCCGGTECLVCSYRYASFQHQGLGEMCHWRSSRSLSQI